MKASTGIAALDSASWRQVHIGHWLRLALDRFDSRVLVLMAHNPALPLALSNLLARGQVGAAHIHITRHLQEQGSRLTDLALRAGMSKQAMAALVSQCEAWGMDLLDARARQVRFTDIGFAWLQAYRSAVDQAQAELYQSVGDDVATVLLLGLEAYAAQ